MDRTYVRHRRMVATAILVVGSLVVAGRVGHTVEARRGPSAAGAWEAAIGTSHYVVVRSGDTLWSIAQRVAPADDPRSMVDAIAETNHVDPGSIVPGQALIVPPGG
jgi:nucleoid-associated protein YgaU